MTLDAIIGESARATMLEMITARPRRTRKLEQEPAAALKGDRAYTAAKVIVVAIMGPISFRLPQVLLER